MSNFFWPIFWVLVIVSLLFVPFYIETDVYYDLKSSKLTFYLCLFNFIKLFGGYITTYKEGIALHVKKGKAILLPYKSLNDTRKKYSFTSSFHLVSVATTIESGVEHLGYILPIKRLTESVFVLRNSQKGVFRLWVKNGDTLKISAKIVVYFTILILIKQFILFIKEKIKLWKKKTLKI